MSSGNTETRILQMQLENKDFEAGVRQTIQSLENLEEKLNLKNAGDGFEKVSAAANSVQMSHLESGIDAVTNKFTLLGQIGMQVLERIASKVVNTGERILRGATIQPMIDGWGEFELKTRSVQTILGGIRKDFDSQPQAINAISDSLDELNKYADKTIYNFAQMTENVGKFTNQGISLEDSTNAIKGIANWAAAVGADPTQMSRAMYNISQSLGAGSMQLIDWRSIRFANMATPEVKKLFAEVAKRVNPSAFDKNGKVRVSAKKSVDVLDDFEASLKAGWLTNDVMAEAFSIYAKAFSKEDLIAKYGEELGTQFYEMGEYAEEAATKVRTFSQLIGVLKEALGSGWANTFDILFGGFEQQTEFFTAIKERIEEIINLQTEDRNNWLQSFADIGGILVLQDVVLKTIDVFKDFYWVINDVVALLLNPFGKNVFHMTDGIFGERQEGYVELRDTWKGVKQVFDDIYATLDKFQKWLYAKNEKSGRSPIHNLASALSGVAGAAGIAWQVLTGFGKFVFRIFKRFEPLVSSVLDLLGQIGGVFYNLFFNLTGQKSIDKIFDKIGDAIEPVVDFVVGLATAVVDLIHNLLGIDAAADDWTVLGEKIQAFFDIFTYDPSLDFATNIKNSVKKALVAIFGEDTANEMLAAWNENIKPILDEIEGFFTRAFGDMEKVLNGLTSAAQADYSQAQGVKGGAKTFISAFLKGYFGEDAEGAEKAFDDVLGIYHQIQTYYDENIGPHVQTLTEIFTKTLPDLNTKIVDFILGKEYDAGDGSKFRYGGLLQTIQEFFEGEDWKNIWTSVESAADSALEKVQGAWANVTNFLFGHEVVGKRGNTWREGGLLQEIQEYFEGEGWTNTWTSIQKAFDSAVENIEGAWNTFYDAIFGKEYDAGDGSKFRYGGILQSVQEYFEGEGWTNTWKSVSGAFDTAVGWIEDAWNTFYDAIFGKEYDAGDGSKFRYGGLIQDIKEFFEGETWTSIKEAFDSVIAKVGEAWGTFYDTIFGKEYDAGDGSKFRYGGILQDVTGFFSSGVWEENWGLIKKAFTDVSKWIEDKGNDAWNAIMNFLFGPETEGEEGKKERSGGAYQAALDFLNPVFDWLKEKGEYLYDYITHHNFEEMWKDLNDLLFGYDKYMYHDGQSYGYKEHQAGLLTPIIEMLQPIVDVFNKVKGWALEKIGGIDWSGIWESIGKFFTGYDEYLYLDGKGYGYTVHHDSVFESIANFFEQIITYFQSPEFQEFWTTVTTFYHEHIEPALQWMGGLGNSILAAIGDIFSGKGFSGFESVGTYLTDGINTLLNKISPGLSLDGLLGGLFGGGSGSSGQTPKTDAGKDATNNGSGGVLDWLVGIITSDANAAEADEAQIADASSSIVATLGDTEKSAGTAIDAQAKTSETIFDKLLKLLPMIGGGMALSKVSDIIIGITGNKKTTLLEQIAGLFGSFGEFFKGLGIVIGAAALAEKISPGALDKAFDRITALLDRVFIWMAGFGLGGSLVDIGAKYLGRSQAAKLFGAEAGGTAADAAGIAKETNFESVGSTIAAVGSSIQALFDGLQTMYNLVWEIAAADWLMGVDDNGVQNFDHKFNRVLGFIGKILLVVLGSEVTAVLSSALDKLATAGITKWLGVNTSGEDTISKLLIGIGSLVEGIGNGVAAILTASAVPALLNADLDQVTKVIDAVTKGIALISAAVDFSSLLSKVDTKSAFKGSANSAIFGAGLGIGIGALLGVVGSVATALFNWFSSSVTEQMKRAAPALYSFASSLEQSLTALSTIKETVGANASGFITKDLPELFKGVTSDSIGFDKKTIDERGAVVRDLGNNIVTGVNALARAKDTFDKYNTGGEESFPLAFFKAMTEALNYMNGGEIKEMYRQFVTDVFGGIVLDVDQEKGVTGVTTFFDTINRLGYYVADVSSENLFNKKAGQELISTKEGLSDFQTAFAGIQATFRALVEDISSEGFSIEKLNSVGDLIKKLVEAGNEFVNAYVVKSKVLTNGGMTREFAEYSPISNLSFWLNQIGEGIRNLNTQLKTDGQYDIDYTQIENALHALDPLADLDARLQGYKALYTPDGKKSLSKTFNWLYGDGINPSEAGSATATWLDKVLGYMEELGTKMHSIATKIKDDDLNKLEYTSSILNSLAVLLGAEDPYASVRTRSIDEIGEYIEAFTNLKASLVVTEDEKNRSIASLIQDVINAAGDDKVKITITPVIDDSEYNAQLGNGLTAKSSYSQMTTVTIDPNSVVKIDSQEMNNQLLAANAKLSLIISTLQAEGLANRGSISGLGGHIDGVADEISNMKIYLDTGTIAGAVDEALGWSMFMAGRTGTPGRP